MIKTRLFMISTIVTAMLAAAGCSDDKGEEVADAFAGLGGAICDCAPAAEQQACRDEFSEDLSEITCEVGVLEDNGLGSFIDCTIDEINVAVACLKGLTCEDETGRGACLPDGDPCGEIPEAVEAEMEATCGEPPFTCDDGSTTDADGVCDGFGDCPDASDEANC